MPPRFFVDQALDGASPAPELILPPGAARHVQVLRLQPGEQITLFDGSGDEWQAEVLRMGRSEVAVSLQSRQSAAHRELGQDVTLAVVMPANDRMDGIVEKATELGAFAIQPLMSERSVLRLNGERAEKKVAHWQAVAVAACEQSGRTRVPLIHPVMALPAWLKSLGSVDASKQRRWLLSPSSAQALSAQAAAPQTLILSGPEGGLSPAEEQAAREQGFVAMNLGPRILRADTAPLAVLGWLALGAVGGLG